MYKNLDENVRVICSINEGIINSVKMVINDDRNDAFDRNLIEN